MQARCISGYLHHMDKMAQDEPGGRALPTELWTAIDHWAKAGLISEEQAVALRADVASPREIVGRPPMPISVGEHHQRRTSLLIEALGYLGGVIILAAFLLVISQFWGDFNATARLITIAASFLLLVSAGFAVPQRLGGPGRRLRSVLWFCSMIAWAGLMGFIGNEYLSMDEDLGLFVAGISIPVAALLWYLHREPLQHVAFLASITVAAGTASVMIIDTTNSTSPVSLPGIAMWGVGVAWFFLAWGGIVRPHSLGLALGSILGIFGAIISMTASGDGGSRAGAILALVTMLAVIAAAVLFRNFMLLVIAAIGTLQGLPIAMSIFFPGTLWAALALLIIGAGLIGAALMIARGRRSMKSTEAAGADAGEGATNLPRDWGHGPSAPAIIASGVVVAGTTAVIVTTSLIS
jgi:hypothetical protein